MKRHVLFLSLLAIFVSCMRNKERATDEASSTKPVAPTLAPSVAPTPVAPTPSTVTSSPKGAMSDQLTWTVSKTGTKLLIGYRYQNTGKAVVYVNDGAIQQLKDNLWTPLKTQFVTLIGPDTALLTIGVPPDTGAFPQPGLYAAVAPGAAFESSRELETPLEARGADGRTQPLPTTITKLALALELFEGEPPKWVEVKTATGTAKFPELARVRAVQVDAKPLP